MFDENQFETNSEYTGSAERMPAESSDFTENSATSDFNEQTESQPELTEPEINRAEFESAENEKSEFERELENYLPTPENTDKLKKKTPQWLFSAGVSTAVCIVLFLIYSLTVLPYLRPSAVISYITSQNSETTIHEDSEDVKGAFAKISESIVTIKTKASYHNFFGISQTTNNGSGCILSSDGYILTSSSLIGNDGETSVTLGNNQKYDAHLVGADDSKDIAIIKIDATDLVPCTLADSSSVGVGDSALVASNLLGGNLGSSITRGIICGVNNSVALGSGSTINLLQTDAATNSSSSGGCLLNTNGDVIGMITYAVSSNSEKISFAIPSNDIKNVAESLINTGNAPESLIIGITGSDTDHGVLVETVMDSTPAKNAGIQTGDLILKVDGTAVTSISNINKIRDTHKKGDTIKITLYRDGESMEVDVTL